MQLDLTKLAAQERAFTVLMGRHCAGVKGCTVCIPWGRGCGKTWFIRIIWYLLVKFWDHKTRAGTDAPGVRIVLLTPTLKQAKRNYAAQITSELSPGGAWDFLGAKINRTDWRIEFPGGSWIQWVSAENADDNRGIRCDAVFIDECDDIDPDIVDSITRPWFSEPFSLRLMLLAGTPRRGRYGLLYRAWKTWPEKLPGKAFAFHATGYDAPEIVSRDYLDEVRLTTPPAIFAREWMCDPDSAEGLVYPMFNEDVHIVTPPSQFNRILVGIDHGFEDPAVFLTIGVVGSGRDATAYVIGEYCKSHKTIDELCVVAAEIHERYPMAEWFADSSAPEKIKAYRLRIGKRIKAATHKIEDGVDVVATMLSPRPSGHGDGDLKPRLYVSHECRNLITEMGMYRRKRDPKNKEVILDDIEDRNNHSQDALRYPTLHTFGGIYSSKRVIEDHDSNYETE